MSLTASSIQKGSIQQRASILIDSLPDPMQRINHLKKNEQRTELQSKISKTEADKLNISYQWMFQFEKMHQERKQLVEKIGSLQVDVVKKDERVKQLEIDSKKNNKTARQFKGLFQEERKTVKRLQQNLVQMCKTLQNSQQEVRQLRLCNWKKKRTIRDLKQNLKKQSSVEMNNDTESDLRTDAKTKYTKTDLDNAVKCVLSDELSLGKASKRFGVPKETIRQAKLKANMTSNQILL